MHNLLCRIIRVGDVRPCYISEIFALFEGFHRFTDLKTKNKIVNSIIKKNIQSKQPMVASKIVEDPIDRSRSDKSNKMTI